MQSEQLKKSPFRTPENYLSSLEKELSNIPKKGNRTAFKKWISYTAIAATFALLVLGGGMLLKWPGNTKPTGYAEVHGLSNDDIVEYLIYTGVDLEDFEDLDLD